MMPDNRQETLLVVDDETDLRELEVLILGRLGYRVLSAEGAVEALRLAATTPTIDLLLTDYSMPGANGLELVRQFREVHPRTPVLMISGSLHMLPGDADTPERFETLAKPFTIQQLAEKVRALLDEHSHPVIHHATTSQ
jgi:DNA-binding NtrC family response regulator